MRNSWRAEKTVVKLWFFPPRGRSAYDLRSRASAFGRPHAWCASIWSVHIPLGNHNVRGRPASNCTTFVVSRRCRSFFSLTVVAALPLESTACCILSFDIRCLGRLGGSPFGPKGEPPEPTQTANIKTQNTSKGRPVPLYSGTNVPRNTAAFVPKLWWRRDLVQGGGGVRRPRKGPELLAGRGPSVSQTTGPGSMLGKPEPQLRGPARPAIFGAV